MCHVADGAPFIPRRASVARRHLPVILQTEAAECGLACLAMLANAYGHELDLSALRRWFSTSLRGTTLKQLIDHAYELGFDSRPLQVELDSLSELVVPCILHWNLNHFVVLKRANGKVAEIHDPARGARKVPWLELSRLFTGIALEVRPSARFRAVKDTQTVSLRAIAGPLRGATPALLQVLLLALGLEVVTLVLPFYTQLVLDQVLITADTGLLAVLSIAFAVVTVLQAGLTCARGWAISWLGGKFAAQWSSNLFQHLLRLPLVFFEKRQSGDIASRFNSVQSIRATLSASFADAVLGGIMGPATMVMLTIYSPHLSAVVLCGSAIYAGMRWTSAGFLWQANEAQLSYAARQATALYESIRGVQAIKLANQQGQRGARFANLVMNATRREVTVQRVGIAFGALNQCLFGLQRIVIVWLGANAVLRGEFSVGMLVAFLAYADQLTNRLGGLVDRFVELRLLRLHAARIADVALSEPEPVVITARATGPIAPAIAIDGISFRYADHEPWILRHCSLNICAGKSVAITGPSGCGKSTLVKLILGLLEPVEGLIRIDGIDIRKFGLKAYRDLIGAVMQDDQLFAGTIADNISFFDQDAAPARIESVARLAAIHDDIAAMPMGYSTLVGDMGSALSGGQKQRVLLARALYREPKILLLDEATSHLDVGLERVVNKAIQDLQMTRIVIAHRPETIASADLRLVLAGIRSEVSE